MNPGDGFKRPATVDATVLIRRMFQQASNRPQSGMDVFPPDWLKTAFGKGRASQRMLDEGWLMAPGCCCTPCASLVR